jgi:hypothetical protein
VLCEDADRKSKALVDIAVVHVAFDRSNPSPTGPSAKPQQREQQTYDTDNHQHETDDVQIDAADCGRHCVPQYRANRDQEE